MKKLLFLLATVCAFTACEEEESRFRNITEEERTIDAQSPELWSSVRWNDNVCKIKTYLVCDKKTNIVYLYISDVHQAGITAYYNAKGEIMRCDELK